MNRVLLTRRQIEFNLEKGLVNKMISYITIRDEKRVGKVQRVTVNDHSGELLVTFIVKLPDKLDRQEWDLAYLIENLTVLYGDTYTGERKSIKDILRNG
ncbi:MAG: hypothetical protein EO766_13270 [Hydrotalea sp. AMD]|uniref:hypothetical protein n=1 Tax=Hydrotalea sp. AMD TaxID=2501297 RepID=UPI001025F0ED|nr:hypothetical protein [Hydrotalea sp. AMD]RWZ86771.1 MAG: hypothetical protein EO766_13270 [Hydrotalea sp. AMD]